MGNKQNKFVDACNKGDLKKIIYLIIKYNINIHIYNEYGFRIACCNGYFNIVKYLLKYNINIHIHMDDAFIVAYANHHIKIAKYLLSHGSYELSCAHNIRILL